MDSPSTFTTFSLFILSLILSGLISGIKLVLGFYQKQNQEFSLSGKTDRFQKCMEESTSIWSKPGFFESLSVGRYSMDAFALFFGALTLVRIFPMGWGFAFFLATVFVFLMSHWAIPLAAQANAPRLGGAALLLYRGFSFFLSWIGQGIHKLNESLLRKLGHEPRLDFLGQTELSRIHPENEGESLDRSGLKEDEKEMIRSIFDLRETQAKEVMTPRVDVISLDINATYREAMDLITHEKFSRIPVYEENIDHIKGVLHTMDLMGLPENLAKEKFRLTDHIRESYFVPRTKKIGELMREFRQKHNHMAIVVDEYGGTSGIITLEDILEEIVGEIHDEDEVETFRIKKMEEGMYVVDPIISISDLKEEIGIDLRPEDEEVHIDTLGGFILYVHGRVPNKGDLVRFKELTFEIVEMDGNKIEKIKLHVPIMAHAMGK